MKNIFFALGCFCCLLGQAQVTLSPAIVTQNDTVTITFDATQGNGALVGVAPIYAHTGVITNLSNTATDWRHVQGNWGTADPKMLMTNIGNNKHTLKIHINSFYNVPSNETVSALAFVFRNAAGTLVGRTSSGGDIFVPISQGGYTGFISTHQNRQYIYEATDTMKLGAVTSAPSTITLLLDGVAVATASNATSLNYNVIVAARGLGFHEIAMSATDGTSAVYDTTHYIYKSGTPIGVAPVGSEEGITIINDSTVFFKIRAPFKSFIYVIGDFNDWYLMPENQLFKDAGGQYFFGTVTGLDKNTEYGFQYYIGNEGMRVADPYSEKILDPYSDGFITNAVYPNLKAYPAGKTSEIVGVFQIEEPAYNWSATNYQRPAKEELVIYELLIRDFDAQHTFASVIERLDYLQWLGVNAIELMPVLEFEGNESWGYNPMFFMAPDKYYGPKNELKRMVDSCHARGIAVILDIALNHSFGQNPMVRMYFDASLGQYGEPTAQSPWFNAQAKHDFNVGYDFNHESAATKYFSKKVIGHWLEEYKIDGYRFDLSKGFTQKNTLGNVNAWGQFDQSRIAILGDYANHIWAKDSTAYVILEHFADNSEETVLSGMGMMLWGNMNHEYTEAAMGFPSNLAGVSHKSRNWPDMHLVGYMESHDEERMMYKTPLFGASNSTYTTKNLDTALQRMALASAFFYTVPGPKMLWQFGELGYDYSINHCPDGTINNNCRISNKPIRWNYFNQPNRKALFDVVGELNYLRKNYPVFRYDKNHELSQTGKTKRLKLQDSTMAVVVLGNFDLIPQNINPAFHYTGWWYEHFSGDSINVVSVADIINLKPGEFRLYTNLNLPKSSIGVGEQKLPETAMVVYPTQFDKIVNFEFYAKQNAVAELKIYNATGALVSRQSTSVLAGENTLEWQADAHLAKGLYLYELQINGQTFRGKILKN